MCTVACFIECMCRNHVLILSTITGCPESSMPNMCRLRIRLGLALRCILRFAVYLVRFTYIDLVDTVTATSAAKPWETT